jgi:hypothetical protein
MLKMHRYITTLLIYLAVPSALLMAQGRPPFEIDPRFGDLILQGGPLLIASIGESYAAGEGAPTSNGTTSSIWAEPQCHNSGSNGRKLATSFLDNMESVNVQLKDVACSGATIHVGARGPFVGWPVNGVLQNALDPQIKQVKDWMTANHPNRRLDVLLLSIGGNDAGFGRVVAKCLTPFTNCSTDAELASLLEKGDPNRATEFLGFDRLDGAFQQLADDIQQQLNPRYVLVTEYPNPLHDEKGEFCHSMDENFEVAPQHLTWGNLVPTTGILSWLSLGGAMKEVKRYEAEFMETAFLKPMNSFLRKVVIKNADRGWRYVGGSVELTYEHGYCSEERWFNTLKDSFDIQGDVSGTAHFNKQGQKVYQWLIQKRIIELFNLPGSVPIEVFSNKVTNIYVSDTKRVLIEVAPTVNVVSGVIQYKLRTTDLAAMINPSQVTLTRDPNYTYRNVFYADLPGTGTLAYGESFHYRPVLHYGRTAGNMNGTFIGKVREFVVNRYREVSSD